MQVLSGRYVNEIVGLTIMLLMIIALIAGQADATVPRAGADLAGQETATLAANLEAMTESAVFRADVKLELDLDQLMDVANAQESSKSLFDLVEIKLETDRQ